MTAVQHAYSVTLEAAYTGSMPDLYSQWILKYESVVEMYQIRYSQVVVMGAIRQLSGVDWFEDWKKQ